MRRTGKSYFLLLTLVLMGSGSLFAANDASLEEVRAKMDAMFEEIGPENISLSPVDGWYTVQKGSIVAYVSEDGRYLLQGDLIDLDQQVNLSERSRVKARKELISTVQDDQAILFSPT